MTALLVGLWVFSLLVGLCQRRRVVAPQVIILPVMLMPAQPELSDEDWLRRQLDGLETR